MDFKQKLWNVGYYKFGDEWYISECNGFVAIQHPSPSIVAIKNDWEEFVLWTDKIYQPNGELLDLRVLKRLKSNFRDFNFEDGYFIIEFGQEKIELKVFFDPTHIPYKIDITYAQLI